MLCKYCANGSVDGVKRLIRSGVDINAGDYDGRTPLHLACSEGKIDVVKELIVQGLNNFNAVDRWSNTPLDDADKGNWLAICDILISKGAKYHTIKKTPNLT